MLFLLLFHLKKIGFSLLRCSALLTDWQMAGLFDQVVGRDEKLKRYPEPSA